MSVFTTELRYIIETWSTAPVGSPVDTVIDGAIPKIFNFQYPIWSSEYKQTLEHKILKYYYFREIGFETAALWQRFLERKLITIMPYYNELYKTVEADYDFLKPYDVWEDIDRDTEGTGTNNSTTSGEASGNSTSNTTQKQTESQHSTQTNTGTIKTNGSSTENSSTLNSDLPQTAGVTPPLDYGTSSQQVDNTGTTNGTTTNDLTVTDTDSTERNTNIGSTDTNTNNSSSKSKNEYSNQNNEHVSNHRHGNPGNRSYSQLIQEFREAIINIDQLIINELEPLFMGLWE